VPHGSVLGPLLLLVYVNDIANAVSDQEVRLFADDTNLFLAGSTVSSVADAADKTVSKLSKWFLENKLSLNIDKICYMVFPPWGWWRWALVSPDGVAPSRWSVCLPLLTFPCTMKSRSFSSGTGSPG